MTGHNSEAQEKCTDIRSETLTTGAEENTRRAFFTLRPNKYASIGCPQMLEKDGNLHVCQPEDIDWQPLLVRPLIENSKVFEPFTDAFGVPTISIARNDQLVPIADAGMAIDFAAKQSRAARNRLTVFLGRRCVFQWPMRKVTAVADKMTKQYQPMFGPRNCACGLWQNSRDCNSVRRYTIAYGFPASASPDAMVVCGAKSPATCQLQVDHFLGPRRPHNLGFRSHDILVIVQRPDLGLLANQ